MVFINWLCSEIGLLLLGKKAGICWLPKRKIAMTFDYCPLNLSIFVYE